MSDANVDNSLKSIVRELRVLNNGIKNLGRRVVETSDRVVMCVCPECGIRFSAVLPEGQKIVFEDDKNE